MASHPRQDLRPGVTEPGVLMISRREAEEGDLASRLSRLKDFRATREDAWLYCGQMTLVVDGYNSDPRELVDTVHGCERDEVDVLPGGLDRKLGALVAEAPAAEGIHARLNGHKFTGTKPTNICNQGRSKAGAQLELTVALRKSPKAVAGVVRAVRYVLLRLADSADE